MKFHPPKELPEMKKDIVQQPAPTPYDPNQYQPAEGEIVPMFAVPFLRGRIPLDMKQVSEDCRDLVAQVKKVQGDNPVTNYTTYFDGDIRTSMHELPWFKEFSNVIKDSYVAFCSNMFQHPVSHLQRDDIHLFAWVNVYNEPHYHPTHNHVNSFMSGTYYIKTDKNAQQIKFTSPNICVNAHHQAVDRPLQRENYPDFEFDGVEGCDSYARYQPREQEFLLWPSYIQHEVPAVDPKFLLNLGYKQEGDLGYERISLSFNLKHRLPIDNNQTGDNISYDFLEENVNA
jgi:uncharacterized protein (TIGR02466 family)